MAGTLALVLALPVAACGGRTSVGTAERDASATDANPFEDVVTAVSCDAGTLTINPGTTGDLSCSVAETCSDGTSYGATCNCAQVRVVDAPSPMT